MSIYPEFYSPRPTLFDLICAINNNQHLVLCTTYTPLAHLSWVSDDITTNKEFAVKSHNIFDYFTHLKSFEVNHQTCITLYHSDSHTYGYNFNTYEIFRYCIFNFPKDARLIGNEVHKKEVIDFYYSQIPPTDLVRLKRNNLL